MNTDKSDHLRNDSIFLFNSVDLFSLNLAVKLQRVGHLCFTQLQQVFKYLHQTVDGLKIICIQTTCLCIRKLVVVESVCEINHFNVNPFLLIVVCSYEIIKHLLVVALDITHFLRFSNFKTADEFISYSLLGRSCYWTNVNVGFFCKWTLERISCSRSLHSTSLHCWDSNLDLSHLTKVQTISAFAFLEFGATFWHRKQSKWNSSRTGKLFVLASTFVLPKG